MNIVLCFSGGISSGKTTLSTAVAHRLGIHRASFGGFVREQARKQNIADTREELQKLGEILIAEMGWEPFCAAVLEAAQWAPGSPLALDGIRHSLAFETIKRIVAPMPTKLVFVDVERDVRNTRVDSAKTANLRAADTHSTEQDVHSGALRSMATIVLDGTKNVEMLVEDVLRIV
jgi:thymidylate kinase